ncbi:hypothetical protein [Streptomyces sp. NPDC056061]|uniref:hypothetical protein n=1 Tax=Streptomyces sp. NPDC056061 TaxID=3345700 RepID=UPI0035E333F7
MRERRHGMGRDGTRADIGRNGDARWVLREYGSGVRSSSSATGCSSACWRPDSLADVREGVVCAPCGGGLNTLEVAVARVDDRISRVCLSGVD